MDSLNTNYSDYLTSTYSTATNRMGKPFIQQLWLSFLVSLRELILTLFNSRLLKQLIKNHLIYLLCLIRILQAEHLPYPANMSYMEVTPKIQTYLPHIFSLKLSGKNICGHG